MRHDNKIGSKSPVMDLDEIVKALSKGPQASESQIDELADRIVQSLLSEEASRALELDHYWPKWSHPWWGIMSLYDLNRSSMIPQSVLWSLLTRVEKNCLKIFPIFEEELPERLDPFREIICFCALGCLLKVILAVDAARVPKWCLEWFVRYQIRDGGYNCDEETYKMETPRSSMVSSLPFLEAILELHKRKLAPSSLDALGILKRGWEYVSSRELCYSLSKNGRLMDPAWLIPIFPNYYFYDVFRGLKFCCDYSREFGRSLPETVYVRAFDDSRTLFVEEDPGVREPKCEDDRTLTPLAWDQTGLNKDPYGTDWQWRSSKEPDWFVELTSPGIQNTMTITRLNQLCREIKTHRLEKPAL